MSHKILLAVTGSVGAFKAAALSSKLTQSGFEVRTVLTSGAKEFIGAPTFEGLTRNRTYSDTFAAGDAMAHIDLARWADLTLVYPASGNTLTKLASGRADDLLGTLFLAHDFKSPYWVVPAMNPSMFSHPAIREAVAKLKEWGITIVDPAEGRMACGEVGEGRLIEPEAMLEEVLKYFEGQPKASGPKVLITAGGTTEAIDPVRVLTNTSTGETGVRLANALAEFGNDVTLLLSSSSPFRDAVRAGVRISYYETFNELDSKMREELSSSDYSSLIHAAAVSDYHVEKIENSAGTVISGTAKIQGKDPLTLRLAPNPKILEKVREYAKNPKLKVISFKLATPNGSEKTDLSGYDSDFIVHNTVSGIERGSDRHRGEIYERGTLGYEVRSKFLTKTDLTKAITEAVNL
jgi:phosphopantothenoylcysteine decarboxylase / phosphopantothenate---cysteine ligase